MQITNINIGMNGIENVFPEQEYEKINTGNNGSFIENSINGQRIKLDKAFKNIKDEDDFNEFRDYKLEGVDIKIIDAISNIYGTMVNNYSNMNPFIIRSRNDEEYVPTYLNICTEKFVPLIYNTNVPIRSTFKTPRTIGCLLYVAIPDEGETNVIDIIAKDNVLNRFCKLSITVTSSKERSDELYYDIDVMYTQELTKDELGKARAISNKLNGKCTTFKFNSDPKNEMVLDTKYVLVPENLDGEIYKDILDIIKERGDKIVTLVVNPEDSIEDLKEYLQPYFNKERIKAFTEIGMSLPYQLLNDLRMLYVFKFEYDERFEKVVKRTIKSN